MEMDSSQTPALVYDLQASNSSDDSNNKRDGDGETEISQANRQLSFISPETIQVSPSQKSEPDNLSVEETWRKSELNDRETQRYLMESYKSYEQRLQIKQGQKNRSYLEPYEEEMIQKIDSNSQQQCGSDSSSECYEDEELEEMPSIKMVRSEPAVKNAFKKQPVVIEDRFDRVTTQLLPIGYKIACIVNIESRFLGLSSKYNLQLMDNKQFVFSAKRQIMKINSNYIISKSYETKQINKRGSSFVGLLKANFTGTQFTFHPLESQDFTLQIDYDKNLMGYSGVRQMKVLKAKPGLKETPDNILSTIISKRKTSKMQKFESLKPTKSSKGWRIDFKGKAKQPSGKNFILKDQKQRQCLLFAKQDENNFLMEVTYPFSILEGFVICLSSLDSKLFCN